MASNWRRRSSSGPRSWSSKRSESALTDSALASRLRTSRVGVGGGLGLAAGVVGLGFWRRRRAVELQQGSVNA